MSETKELQRLLTMNRRKVKEELAGPQVARVVRVNPESIDVQPVVPKVVQEQTVQFPVFRNVPPIFMYGGGSSETWPIAEGDYCLLIVCESCFDNWYIGRDGIAPPEPRRFDYSDCFAIVGVKPLADALNIPSIITRTGETLHNGKYTHNGETEHTGDLNRTGNKVQAGNSTINGLVTCQRVVMNNTSGTPSTTAGNIEHTGDIDITGKLTYDDIETDGQTGVSGTFTSGTNTITVTNGIITDIS